MVENAVLGVENEFWLMSKNDSSCSGLHNYFSEFAERLQGEHFKKGYTALRLSTGGAFYIDGSAPEITSAPFFVQPGSAEATAHNLFANLNLVLGAINSYNSSVADNDQVHLQGHSGHFNFTFPHTGYKTSEIARLLTKTVNPALRLFIQNRESTGGMYRHRSNGRVEVCGEYIPGVDNLTSALAFQLIMFQKIDEMLKLGATTKDIEEQFRYTLPGIIQPASSRSGYALKTPEINTHGRDAKLELVDRNGKGIIMRAQGLLEHYFQLFEPYVDQILSADEKTLLMDHISGNRLLHIDAKGLPIGYNHVHHTKIDQEKAMSGLGGAFGRAAGEYKVGKHELKPSSVDWKSVGFQYKNGDEDNKVVTFNVPQNQLMAFDKIVREHPELMTALAKGEFSTQEMALFQSYGITNPTALVKPPSFPVKDFVYDRSGFGDFNLGNLNLGDLDFERRPRRSLEDLLSRPDSQPNQINYFLNDIYSSRRIEEPIREIYNFEERIIRNYSDRIIHNYSDINIDMREPDPVDRGLVLNSPRSDLREIRSEGRNSDPFGLNLRLDDRYRIEDSEGRISDPLFSDEQLSRIFGSLNSRPFDLSDYFSGSGDDEDGSEGR